MDPADDLDLNWSPCLMSAPFGEMENDRSRYIKALSTSPCRESIQVHNFLPLWHVPRILSLAISQAKSRP